MLQATLRLDDLWFDQLREALISVGESRTGVRFDPASGPSEAFAGRPGEIGHVILTHLLPLDQAFERALTHPVKKVLMTYLLGENHRLSASDGWIKWQTPDAWRGEETTGFHADQSVVPAPWNWKLPHIANTSWLLTDYSRENGALAYVPGSHREERLPEPDEALPQSVPVEASAGSLVVFRGGLWHGAYWKTSPGLRLTMLGVHCRNYILPGQELKGEAPDVMFGASEDADYLRSLLREGDERLSPPPPAFGQFWLKNASG